MYLDPAFGGMLLQVLIALVAAGGAIVFALRKKIKALFQKNKAPKKIENDESKVSEEVIDTIDPMD